MTTLLATQANPDAHRTPAGHVERPERLEAVREALEAPRFSGLVREAAHGGDLNLIELVHAPAMFEAILRLRPAEGMAQIDADTYVSAGSLDAAAQGLGAGLRALDAVVLGEVDNAFCAIRPPGHHAESARAMGFCLFNTAAILARQAQRLYGAERIAIVDFDVHHGNGTQDIFWDDPSVFYASSHQMPLYPGTGFLRETGCGNIVNAPLPPGSGGAEMRAAYRDRILPALDAFRPDILLISAGFDAERRDPLAQLEWEAEDFAWVTGKLMDAAERHCAHRIVSLLEGGYDLDGLADGVSAHVAMLKGGVYKKESDLG